MLVFGGVATKKKQPFCCLFSIATSWMFDFARCEKFSRSRLVIKPSYSKVLNEEIVDLLFVAQKAWIDLETELKKSVRSANIPSTSIKEVRGFPLGGRVQPQQAQICGSKNGEFSVKPSPLCWLTFSFLSQTTYQLDIPKSPKTSQGKSGKSQQKVSQLSVRFLSKVGSKPQIFCLPKCCP